MLVEAAACYLVGTWLVAGGVGTRKVSIAHSESNTHEANPNADIVLYKGLCIECISRLVRRVKTVPTNV